jgi:hypothetical protein
MSAATRVEQSANGSGRRIYATVHLADGSLIKVQIDIVRAQDPYQVGAFGTSGSLME